jgi:signal peptidase II
VSIPTNNFRSPAALTRFVGVTLLGLALDLWTKSLAFSHLLISLTQLPNGTYQTESNVYKLIPGWLHFEVTVNQGAVFGIGQGQRWLFLAVSVAAIAFLSYLFAVSRRQPLYQIILGMLLAGVLGNMYDRILFGYVRDMIHALPLWPNPLIRWFPTWQYVFPWIFNVADSLLCVGVGLMLVYSLITPKHPVQDPVPVKSTSTARPR